MHYCSERLILDGYNRYMDDRRECEDIRDSREMLSLYSYIYIYIYIYILSLLAGRYLEYHSKAETDVKVT